MDDVFTFYRPGGPDNPSDEFIVSSSARKMLVNASTIYECPTGYGQDAVLELVAENGDAVATPIGGTGLFGWTPANCPGTGTREFPPSDIDVDLAAGKWLVRLYGECTCQVRLQAAQLVPS